MIRSNSLASSPVDLAAASTDVISARRSWQAKAKVIQARPDLLDVVDRSSG